MTVALAAPEGRTKSVVHRPFAVPPSLTELGRRMREARLRRGYSQTQAALFLGVKKQTISNWELGTAPPGLINMFRYAAVMDIDVAELITGLSDDLAPTDVVRRRLSAASRLVPLYRDIEAAGELLMHAGAKVAPERFIAPLAKVADESISFAVTGKAMEPRFVDGDVVIVTPVTMAERGSLVVAYADGKYVFRKFLPKIEGKVEGAILRALNAEYLDIEMAKGDAILGRLDEHVSHRQG
jgi:transcriptional regulator with XRE-family HTH domain